MKFILLVLCSVTLLAQNVKIEKIPLEGRYYYPKVVNDSLLILTKEDFSGLYLYNTIKNEIAKISDERGAGYGSVFSDDEIYYRPYEIKQGRKYFSLKKFNFYSKENTTIQTGERYISLPVPEKDGIIYTTERNNWVVKQNEIFVTNEDSKVWLHEGNSKKLFEPLGEGVYVWPELSPDKKKIAFTFGSKGSFIFDLNGKLLIHLGKEAHYPKWSPDGKFIVYMTDKDDGHRIISSDIVMIEVATGKKIEVSKTSETIEMYPCWNKLGDQIYFNDLDGNIYRADIFNGRGE